MCWPLSEEAMNGQRMSTPAVGISRAVVSWSRISSGILGSGRFVGDVEIAPHPGEGSDDLTETVDDLSLPMNIERPPALVFPKDAFSQGRMRIVHEQRIIPMDAVRRPVETHFPTPDRIIEGDAVADIRVPRRGRDRRSSCGIRFSK